MNENIKQKSKSVWGETPAGSSFSKTYSPGSKEFFTEVLKKRSEYEQPWLSELIPFSEFTNKNILELGCGAGYDAYSFCKFGADYTGIDIAPPNPHRVINHLRYFDLTPKVLVGDAENLMFPDKHFDIVYSNGVLHHTPNMLDCFKETYRVLKTDGVFWVILYNRNSLFYWLTVFLRDYIFKLGFLKRSPKEQRSLIEYTFSDEKPLVNVYTRRELNSLLKISGFSVENIWIRKLVAEDLPLHKLATCIPQSLLDSIAKYAGWYLIAKAKKG